MLPSIDSHVGQALRLVISAMVTAVFVLGLAFLLLSTPERRSNEARAFQEIERHRIVSRCAFHELVNGMNRLLEADGLETIPSISTDGIDCDKPLPEIAEPSAAD